MLSFQAELCLQVANISRRPHLSIYFDSSQTAKSDDKTDKSLNFADIKDNILALEDENQFVKNQGLSPSNTFERAVRTRCIGRTLLKAV